MDLTEKNGQPSMEEILASIRRIIAEEPQGPNPVIDLNARNGAGRADLDLDEGQDFELPSMFRPAPAAPAERQTPLFGRLTDAIRGASHGVSADPKPLRAHEPPVSTVPEASYANGHGLNGHGTNGHGTNGHGLNGNGYNGHSTGSGGYVNGQNGHALDDAKPAQPSLSSLNLSRSEPAAKEPPPYASANRGSLSSAFSAITAPATATEPVDAVPGNAQMPRRMAAFKDTRFSMMSSQTAEDVPAPAPASSALEATALRTPGFGTLVPLATEPLVSDLVHGLTTGYVNGSHAEHNDQQQVNETPFIPAVEYAPLSETPPPIYPQLGDAPASPEAVKVEAGLAPSGVDDVTADLLRPMLRQWLADNMPRMVEKALHIEVAESVKMTRKFNGS
jgi:uncharacterized protein